MIQKVELGIFALSPRDVKIVAFQIITDLDNVVKLKSNYLSQTVHKHE